MTNTLILDEMMKALARNPMTPERMGHLSKNAVEEGESWGVDRQQIVTDERPFYAGGEVVSLAEANRKFADAVDLFHEDLSAPRKERPRQGSCPRVKREFDGQRWVQTEACGGIVHAVETVVNGAIRVDGRCLSCGTEIHRAGLLSEKG